ncbi:semaphorin-4E [Brachionichthys hirsutus]|uniref:semaphorin-4E n=1 Tax=Brachionichthys hirsutus TaxID=412623 RepID=UPI003604D373
MRLPLLLVICWLLPPATMLEEDSPLGCVPRRSVTYHGDNANLFREEGVFNYSTMLLREDVGLLMLGAREAVYALDLNNISKKVSSVKWEVTQQQEKKCGIKRDNLKMECKNYIRILHKVEDDKMYVCGTNAFDPECDYMSYKDGKLTLENKTEDGKGKCPFDPHQRYASLMFEKNLYSATSTNFLGLEPVLTRSTPVTIRSEFKTSWLHEPTFVSMADMPESETSAEGDDDKVYLFFREIAVECDCYNRLVVSRVARVCKGDLGGQRTLQKKWTSFMKARMDCPVLESQLPYIIQDAYRWCDPQQSWKECLFYAVFTPQKTSDLSAVCAYCASDISRVFAEGKYKTPVTIGTSVVKWVMYSGDVPVPRPGACINNEARNAGIADTLDLPDPTLQFIKLRPLMDQAIQPVGQKPLLVRRGAAFSRIVVTQVQAADGKKHNVMFIGTEEGTILKAVNYNGEMFIIEEVQLFQAPEPIKILKFSNVTGQLYAGSDYGVAQMPLATCERSSSCMSCVLARDPYCGWDKAVGKCVRLSSSQREIIQSVMEGDASFCPKADPVKRPNESIWPGGNLKLHCPSPSNLAKTTWERDGAALTAVPHLQFLRDGLLILNASHSDAGRYRCLSVEHSKSGTFTTTVAEYQVSIGPTGSGKGSFILPEARRDGPSVTGLQVVIGLLVVCLLALLTWNFYKGHLPLPWNCRKKSEQSQEQGDLKCGDAQRSALTEDKPLVSVTSITREEAALYAPDENDHPNVNLPSLQFIDDE